MEAKEYPKFDARGVREHYESKQREYWKREVIKEVVECKIYLPLVAGNYTIRRLLELSGEGQAKLKEWNVKTE